jgi:hypothetical protein
LREFKYNHKWLERRVFVQQTPSDQLTQLVETPRANLCTASSQEGQPKTEAKSARAEPFAVYDYLRIKEESRPEGARRDFPQAMRDSVGRNLSAPPERVPPQVCPFNLNFEHFCYFHSAHRLVPIPIPNLPIVNHRRMASSHVIHWKHHPFPIGLWPNCRQGSRRNNFVGIHTVGDSICRNNSNRAVANKASRILDTLTCGF